MVARQPRLRLGRRRRARARLRLRHGAQAHRVGPALDARLQGEGVHHCEEGEVNHSCLFASVTCRGGRGYTTVRRGYTTVTNDMAPSTASSVALAPPLSSSISSASMPSAIEPSSACEGGGTPL